MRITIFIFTTFFLIANATRQLRQVWQSRPLTQQCGQSPRMRPISRPDPDLRILVHNEARPGTHPWLVSLQRNNKHHCGGSLIRVSDKNKSDIILTAAHCFNEGKEDFTITLGAHNLERTITGQIKVKADRVVIHDGYNRNTLANDIALIKTETPTDFSQTISPICLPSPNEEIENGKVGRIAGWPREKSEDRGNYITQAGYPVVSNQVCVEKYNDPTKYAITPNGTLCAGYLTVDNCRQGDDGSPFIVKTDGTHTYVQHGIVSIADGCVRIGLPGINTYVSHYIDWIWEKARSLTKVDQ